VGLKLGLNPAHPEVRAALADRYRLHRLVYALFDDPAAARPLFAVVGGCAVILRARQAPELCRLPGGALLSVEACPAYLAAAGTPFAFRLEALPSVRQGGRRRPAPPDVWVLKAAGRAGFIPADRHGPGRPARAAGQVPGRRLPGHRHLPGPGKA